MDVHAPHQPVHTWRDFAIHLTIVTIGLFIALSLEGLVEYLHHRHLVHVARENIREELRNNHDAAQKDVIQLDKGIAQQKSNIKSIHGLMEDGEHFHGSVNNAMDITSFSNAAWHTARDTGALGFMPYDEVQRYSDLYDLQALVTSTSLDVARQQFIAGAPFQMGYEVTKLPHDEYANLLRDNARLQVQLMVLKELNGEYDTAILAELKSH